jgi:hypothetical protein
VTEPLQTVLIVASLLLALVAVVYVVLDRPADRLLLGGAALLELGLLVQLVVGIVKLAGTDRDVSGATFVGYLVGALVVPPAAMWWAKGEPARSGTAVFVLAGLVVAFLIVRLDQIWSA